MPYAAVKFMAYEQYKSFIPGNSSFEKFLAGALAGSTAVWCTYPLDLLRVRIAFENASFGGAIKAVYNEPNRICPKIVALRPVVGILNFYRGFMPTLYGIIPYAGVSFLTYETIKEHLIQNLKERQNLAYLVSGAVSGVVAQTCSYPMEIIRRHMQVAGKMDPSNTKNTTFWTAKEIFKTRGIGGFWVGLGIGYLKIIPMFAVSFFSYEYMKKTLGIS
jgi:solute carrier family 25 protein 16